ncbi:MAG TPA: LamG-like jellyroll fold domain-containing protein, partial [Vicinamibacterales bacterium]|nr:LamG-like jellyroll fold domain-containing protein [Vicinamibacterales bacterium]
WYHAAATYDGSTWRLYLNGALEAQTSVGAFTPRSDSIQHAAIATALNSSGTPAGFFNGTIDEARVWNTPRSATQIAAAMGSEIASASGLIGRWGLNEGFGGVTEDSSGSGVAGALSGGPSWAAGSPFAHTPLPAANYGLDLSGNATARDYVTFGAAPGLGAATFTIETWFRRDGTGVATSTGSGGVVAIPLLTKGMAEADGSSQDMNYFLGIRSSDNVLVADFEDTATGGNHPVAGATAITSNVWHHAAATFDGTAWTLYLDGAVEATLAAGGFVPRADSLQHAALGTALNSTGGVGSQTQGFFDGAFDEPRVWNYARSAAQIASGTGRPIPAATGLLGRWSLDTVCAAGVVDTSGQGNNGTLNGSSWRCVPGAPMTGSANLAPVVDAGTNQIITLPASATLAGVVTDDGIAGPLVVAWSMASGPGAVTFGNSSSSSTTATFSAAGSYTLQLTASDGEVTASDVVTVTVNPSGPVNQAPVVDAGVDQAITLPSPVTLVGSVSDDGLPGTDVTTTWSKISGPGTVTFADPTATSTTATFSADGSYVLQLSASDGALTSSDTLTVTVTTAASSNGAIDFGGTNAYVTFGQAPGLGASTFTLELWFRRDGTGVVTNTGSGGIDAVPLVSKGRAQSDGSNVDMNYFFGIAGNVLAADFEEGAAGATPGLNHPVSGATTIANNTWYHAAATYDGTTWRLYLNGVLDAQLAVGQPPRADSIQHAAIASALTSTGTAAGFFDGVIDEVRIWNHARTVEQIRSSMNLEIAAASGLLARWGLNEGSGATVVDSSGNGNTGTITGSAFARVAGTTFRSNQAPAQPTLNTPANGASGTGTAPTLSVNVSDGDADPMTVTFLGRPVQTGTAPDFTLVAIPDTQHYVDDVGRAPTFTAQTQWIVDNRAALNIAFVSHLGDIVEHIDDVPEEWTRANASLSLLETNAFKWGLAPGNHDMNSSGVATNYDLTFPVSRFAGNAWYGGYLGADPVNDPVNRQNKNNYELFSVGGLDFLIIHLEYDMPDYAVAWANRILQQYPNRRAIISTHLFLNASGVRPTTVLNRSNGTPAETVWQQIIRNNCNVFLVLNGHYPGEANRTDLNACGQPVHQLASDFQSRT